MGRWYLHRIRRLADLAALEQASVVLFVVAALTVGCAASGSSARKAHATNQPGQLGRSMYWAAGGKFIVYEGRGLWVMRADGSHKRRLADGSSRPALSPRGRMLAQLTGTPEELGADTSSSGRSGQGSEDPFEHFGFGWRPPTTSTATLRGHPMNPPSPFVPAPVFSSPICAQGCG